MGCGKTKAIGNVAAARLAGELAGLERVQTAAESLFPNTGLVRPAFVVLVKCGAGDVPEAAFTARGYHTFLVVPCRAGVSSLPAVEGLVRHAVERSFDNPPLWLSVGLARSVRAMADPSQRRLGVLADDLVALRGPWLPVRTVLSATSESETWQDASLRRRFAAQAGFYVAYWAAQHPRGDLGHLMTERSVAGPAAALENGLGQDLDDFGSGAEGHYRNGTLSQKPLEPSAPSEEVGCPGVTSEAEATALWIHAMAGRHRLLEAKALSEAAMARFPDVNPVRAAHARVLADLGSTTKSLKEFRRLRSSGGLGDADEYVFTETLLGATKTSPAAASPAELFDAEQRMGGAENDLPADAYGLRSRAALARGDAAGAALNALEAFARWPRHEFALLAARAYLQQGNTSAAFATLRDLARAGETADVRRAAAELLETIPPDGRHHARMIPVFRRPAAGEHTRIGRLVSIDCGEFWTFLTVDAETRRSRYAITRLAFLEIRSHGATSAPSVGCGARGRPEMVRLTWRTETSTPKGADGIASALEFLP